MFSTAVAMHDDVIKWKHFPRYWPFVRGIHRSPVNSSHKGLWRGALMFSLICVWINGWVNNREAGDLRRYRAYYDVNLMCVWSVLSMVACRTQRHPKLVMVHVHLTRDIVVLPSGCKLFENVILERTYPHPADVILSFSNNEIQLLIPHMISYP